MSVFAIQVLESLSACFPLPGSVLVFQDLIFFPLDTSSDLPGLWTLVKRHRFKKYVACCGLCA